MPNQVLTKSLPGKKQIEEQEHQKIFSPHLLAINDDDDDNENNENVADDDDDDISIDDEISSSPTSENHPGSSNDNYDTDIDTGMFFLSYTVSVYKICNSFFFNRICCKQRT